MASGVKWNPHFERDLTRELNKKIDKVNRSIKPISIKADASGVYDYPEATQPTQVTNIDNSMHFNGDVSHSRVSGAGSSVTNNSLSPEEDARFEELFAKINEIPENSNMLKAFREMKESAHKKSFGEKYSDFIEVAANHATILSTAAQLAVLFIK